MAVVHSFSAILTRQITFLTTVQTLNITDTRTVRRVIADALTSADTFANVSTFDIYALIAGYTFRSAVTLGSADTLAAAYTLARADTLTSADTVTIFRNLVLISSWNVLTLIASFLNRFQGNVERGLSGKKAKPFIQYSLIKK